MKTTKNYSRLLACSLSLMLTPLAFAGGGADKKFTKMDTDGDGRVTRQEHSAGAQRMFAEMDADRDGIVTASEMDAKKDKHASNRPEGKPNYEAAKPHPQESEHGQMSAREKIAKIDQNGDGRITAQEHASGTAAMFDMMDTNRDGFLSKEECDSGHKAMERDRT